MSTNKKFRIQNGVDITGEVVVGNQLVITAEGKLVLPAITEAVNEAVASDLAALQAQVDAILGTSPEHLDTLQEIVALFQSEDGDISTLITNNSTAITQIQQTLASGVATAAQGALADTAAQQADLDAVIAQITNGVATSAQGALADTAVQPEDFSTGFGTTVSTVIDYSSEGTFSAPSTIINTTPSGESFNYGKFDGNSTHVAYYFTNPKKVSLFTKDGSLVGSTNLTKFGGFTFTEEHLAVHDAGTVTVYDMDMNVVNTFSVTVESINSLQPRPMVFSGDTLIVVTGSDGDTLKVYNWTTGADVSTISLTARTTDLQGMHAIEISDMSVSGNKLFVGNFRSGTSYFNGGVHVVDLTSYTEINVINSPVGGKEGFGYHLESDDEYLVVWRSRKDEGSNERINGALEFYSVSDYTHLGTVKEGTAHSFNDLDFAGNPSFKGFDLVDGYVIASSSHHLDNKLYFINCGDLSTHSINMESALGLDHATVGMVNVCGADIMLTFAHRHQYNGNLEDFLVKVTAESFSATTSFVVDDSLFATKDYVDSGVAGVDLSGYTDTSDMTTAIATAQAAAISTASADATAKADAAIASASADATAKADQAETDAKAYADQVVAATVDAAPAALDTLNELAAALGDDANFASTVTTSLADKATAAQGALADTAVQPEDLGDGFGTKTAISVDPTSVTETARLTSGNLTDYLHTATDGTYVISWNNNGTGGGGPSGAGIQIHLASDNSYVSDIQTDLNYLHSLHASDGILVVAQANYNNWQGKVVAYDIVTGNMLWTKLGAASNHYYGRMVRVGSTAVAIHSMPDGYSNAAGRLEIFDLSGNLLHTIDGTEYYEKLGLGLAINSTYFAYNRGVAEHYQNTQQVVIREISSGNVVATIDNPNGGSNGFWAAMNNDDNQMDMSETNLVIGSSGKQTYVDGVLYKGAAFVYDFTGTLLNTFADVVSSVDNGTFFGTGVATEGDLVYVGAHSERHQYTGLNADRIEIFSISENAHKNTINFVNGDTEGTEFGREFFVSGSVLAAGATNKSNNSENGSLFTVFNFASSTQTSFVVDDSVFATKDYVDSGVAGVDLSAYSTTTEMDSAIAVETAARTAAIAAIPATDLTPYSTTAEMNAAIATSETDAKAYADQVVAATVDAAPAALDTLNELAAALGDDANFASTVTASIATKADDAATTAALATKVGLAEVDVRMEPIKQLAESALQPSDLGAGITTSTTTVSDWGPTATYTTDSQIATPPPSAYSTGSNSTHFAVYNQGYLGGQQVKYMNLYTMDGAVVKQIGVADDAVAIFSETNLALVVAGTVTVYDLNGDPVSSWSVPFTNNRRGFAFYGSDKLVIGGQSNSVYVYDWTNGTLLSTIVITTGAEIASISVSGDKAFVGNWRGGSSNSGQVVIIDLSTNTVESIISNPAGSVSDDQFGMNVKSNDTHFVVSRKNGAGSYRLGSVEVFKISDNSHMGSVQSSSNSNIELGFGFTKQRIQLTETRVLVLGTSSDVAKLVSAPLSTPTTDVKTITLGHNHNSGEFALSGSDIIILGGNRISKLSTLTEDETTNYSVDTSVFATKDYVDSGVAGNEGRLTTAENNLTALEADLSSEENARGAGDAALGLRLDSDKSELDTAIGTLGARLDSDKSELGAAIDAAIEQEVQTPLDLEIGRGSKSLRVGRNTVANTDGGIAIGDAANAAGAKSIALGTSATPTGDNGIEIKTSEAGTLSYSSDSDWSFGAPVTAPSFIGDGSGLTGISSDVTSAIAAEETRATSAESGLQTQISNILSNTDSAALNSLAEIVTEFQNADSTLTGVVGGHGTRLTDLEGRTTDNIPEGDINKYWTEERVKTALTGGLCINDTKLQATGEIAVDEVEAEQSLRVAEAVVSDDTTKLEGQGGSHYRIDIYDVNGTIVN